MISINKCIIFIALTLTTATALSHGHVARSNSHYEVARNVIDGLSKKDLTVPEPAIRRRASNSQRCKARPKAAASSSTSSSPHHNATPAKADVAPPKATPTSSETHTSTKAADTPKPSPKTSSSNGSGSSSGGGGGQKYSGGHATYYTQNGVQGACGTTHSDSDLICALFTSVYAGGQHCGQEVLITNLNTGKVVKVLAVDECPTCSGESSLDLSEGAFEALGGTKAEGEFPVIYTIL